VLNKTHIKETLTLAGPVAFSQFGHISVGVVDTLMAGQINKEALAAATVALSVFYPLFMLYIGFSYGFTPLISQADGEGDGLKIARILKHALVLNIAVGLLLTALLCCCIYVIPYLNQPAHCTACNGILCNHCTFPYSGYGVSGIQTIYRRIG
jgi:MATE family multidrug resistance protein